MIANLMLFLLEAAASFATLMLLARFFMQWQRVSFHNQLGQFVLATTDWCVRPLRRILPGLFGLDLASLLPAWVIQTLLVFLQALLFGASLDGNPAAMLLGLWGIGLVGVLKMMVYMVIGIVLISAVFSWVNPHAPLAPLFFSLSAPFLRPLRKIIPPIANVDISPLILLLLLQVVLMLLSSFAASFSGLMFIR